MILGLNWACEKLNLTFAKFKFETDFGLRFFLVRKCNLCNSKSQGTV